MSNNNQNEKFIPINRLTSRELIEEGIEFWKVLPSSKSKSKNICSYYFTNKECPKKGHISPRRTNNGNCLMCEISPESMNKKSEYHKKNKEEISKKQKKKYKELTKDSDDARYNKESPEKRLKDILEEINSEKTLEDYIKGFDESISTIIKNIEDNDKYFLGDECNYGHNYNYQCLRITYGSRNCYKCKLINGLIYSLENKEKLNLKKSLRYHNLEPDKKKERIQSATKWNQENKDAHKKADEKWKKKNPEKRKEVTRKDRQENKGRVNNHTSNRRGKRIQATPQWLESDQTRPFFDEAASLSKSTKIKHSVDHIDPLNHELVCGLEVPWNFEVIPLSSNQSKSNKFTPYRIDADNNRYELEGLSKKEMIYWKNKYEEMFPNGLR